MAVSHHYKIRHSEFLTWSQSDRDKAIWSLVRERSTCGGCHTRREEWNPKEGGHLAAYAPVLELCHGCRAIEQERERHGDDGPPAGSHIVLKPRKGGPNGR